MGRDGGPEGESDRLLTDTLSPPPMRPLSFLSLALAVTLTACSTGPMNSPDISGSVTLDAGALSPSNTIVENAMTQPELSTLVSALQRADLVSALSGDGPYTVFAPINQAFAGVDVASMSAEELAETLTYHVVEGDLAASSLTDGLTLPTLASGENLTITLESGGDRTVQVDGASVIYPDIRSSNGRIHLINAVLDPLAQGVTSVD